MTVAPSITVTAEFSARFRAAQEARGFTDPALGSHAGTNRNHVRMMRSGEHSPHLMTLWRFGRALKVPPAWLADGSTTVPGPVEVVVPHQDAARLSFRTRLVWARERNGWSRKDLTEAMGFTGTSQLTGFEAGRVGSKLTTLHAFSVALGAPVAWLMDLSKDIEPWDA